MLTVASIFTEYAGPRGPVRAAQDISFDVPEGKFFTLLGPSGCGKTTTLRSIAGLERPTAGDITVAGRVVFSAARGIFVAPNQRKFGMVFQSYAIWPHMNVFANAAFPLEVSGRRLSRREIKDKVMRVLTAVGLDHLADREATRLSGGQQQRLALARALVMEPALLLLDEPLSNLDAKLRERMRFELKRIQRELRITTIYVTHDQSEALALSHEIAVMNEGRIIQLGSPRDIYERPRTRFVADFIGTTNFLKGKVAGANGKGAWRMDTQIGPIDVRCDDALVPGQAVALSVRPEDIELSDTSFGAEEARNPRTAQVDAKVFLGEYVDFRIKLADTILLARAHPSLDARVGEPVHFRIDPAKCVVLADGDAPAADTDAGETPARIA